MPGSLARPLRNVSSTAKAAPATLPPSCWISLIGGCGGAARGEEVVAKQDGLAGLDGVLVEFELVGAVFELVGDGGSFSGKLFWFAHGNETGTQTIGQCGGENEAAGFDAGDDVHFGAVVLFAELVNERMEAGRVFEQGGEVVEQNARLGIIGDFADQSFQVGHSSPSFGNAISGMTQQIIRATTIR